MTRVLFLGGLGRSGTTLVERILGQLPGVIGLGEVVHLWQRDLRDGERCGCGEPFLGCRFWQAVGERAFGGWQRVDVDRVLHLQRAVERTRHIPRLALAAHRTVREYTGYYQRIYTAAAELTGARLVIDSSKHSAFAWCLSHGSATLASRTGGTAGIDLRVAQVVRDARGVAYSWTKRVTRPESSGDEMTRYPPGRSALLWNAQNVALSLLAWRGVPVVRVPYERFVADPHRGVRELATFAGLDVSTLRLDFLTATSATLDRSHSAAGNPMRFTVGTVALRRDDAWRRELAPRHRRLVATLCAPLLAAYGYPLR